jgi:RNA polymerase sigma-70 factor (ECF subfamily)
MMRDRDGARDALQDVFFRIWQKAYLYDRSKGSAFAWMITITRRSVLDRLATSRHAMLSLDEVDEELLSNATSALGAGSVESVKLKGCLERLDAKYSRAILMAYLYGLTHQELSKTLRVPLGTAKSWVTRGLAQLQSCMSGGA